MASAATAIRTPDACDDGRRARHGRVAVNLLCATWAALVVCLTWSAGAWAVAPSNDAFDAAAPIGSLPFSDSLDMTDASVESGEPEFCYGNVQSAWYSITPTESGMLAIDTVGSDVGAQVTLYRADGVVLDHADAERLVPRRTQRLRRRRRIPGQLAVEPHADLVRHVRDGVPR